MEDVNVEATQVLSKGMFYLIIVSTNNVLILCFTIKSTIHMQEFLQEQTEMDMEALCQVILDAGTKTSTSFKALFPLPSYNDLKLREVLKRAALSFSAGSGFDFYLYSSKTSELLAPEWWSWPSRPTPGRSRQFGSLSAGVSYPLNSFGWREGKEKGGMVAENPTVEEQAALPHILEKFRGPFWVANHLWLTWSDTNWTDIFSGIQTPDPLGVGLTTTTLLYCP